ncbi:hypothetical protein FOA43_000177 [Brettanomyces nanus]|uniref:CDC20/Fizzy WD40 domain-containing protein n=1 Tax=Eeniella nana TaxID=13502 RepID=A0A875S090_EENNA|nr:uncharacterized protein FOA43_000177 [Brettanomyces nanus]QPG72874.1 hypothetical protein FOA43_000177 [Brettanomyces nanus]
MDHGPSVAPRSFPQHQTELQITGDIIDRFIPEIRNLGERSLHSSCFKLLHEKEKVLDLKSDTSEKRSNARARSAPRSFHIQNGYFLVSPNLHLDITTRTESETSSEDSDSSTDSLLSGSSSTKAKLRRQGDRIAGALGFKRKSRILSFKPFSFGNTHNNKHVSFKMPSVNSDSFVERFARGKSQKRKKEKNESSSAKEISFKVLDAPGLRNDYYSNTVCWSKESDVLAVGLGAFLYIWNEKQGTIPMQRLNSEIVSSVSYSSSGILAVGTKTGRITLYDSGSQKIAVSSILKPSTGISCIKWVNDHSLFYAGDDSGDVALYEFEKNRDLDGVYRYTVVTRMTIRCNQQQVCGIDVNPECTQLAVGSNDNSCTLYRIDDLRKPKKMFTLNHQAAVKAVAFCPWMSNLLSTGGGSKDRCIRFWHTTSGTLVKKFETKGQVTSLIWSRSRKELLATFGFGSPGEKNGLLRVYAYPSLRVVKKVDSNSEMRVLTADLSYDQKYVCAGLSDQSVRIYSIWNSKYDLRIGNYDSGLFESQLIELEEGVNNSFEIIR